MDSIAIPGLPGPLTCFRQNHAEARVIEPGVVTLTAHAKDDMFADPGSDSLVMSASAFTFEATGDFQFRARVRVRFQEKFDSGVLVGLVNDEKWFKICAELDPLGNARVVTVVTDGRSDDANHTLIVGDDVHLRITRTGAAIALHSSDDGVLWDLARYFTLGDPVDRALRLGIAAQSPAGEGTDATFSEFGWKPIGLNDNRDGT